MINAHLKEVLKERMSMFPYNYHTHTRRCGHASGSDEEYVLAAIKAGYKVLGFSDHAPYRDYPHPGSHMDWEQLEDYISSINALKEKYKDQITILLGTESEYYPYCLEERKELRSMLDYMLLGQHYDHPSGKGVNYFKENTDEEILVYAKTVVEAADSGLYSYLCHPDVFMNHQNDFTKACEEAAHMIGQACERNQLPVELNVRGVMKGKKPFPNGDQYWYPHKDFWRILAKYDLKVVVGIDAHAPDDLLETEFIDEGIKELSDLNLTFIDHPFI